MIEHILWIAESIRYCPYCEEVATQSHYCPHCKERFIEAIGVPKGFVLRLRELLPQ